MQRTLFVWGWYEPQCTKVVMEWLKEGMTVVDIGANVGYYALLEAKIVGDKGMVYAIEPAPNNLEGLGKNVTINSLSNVEIYPLAVGDKSGKGELYLSVSSNLHNMLGTIDKSGPRSSYTGVVEVETTTLDDFLKDKRQPDLVRMDVEGYEYFIIKGMQRTLNQNRNIRLYIEIHPSDMKTVGLEIETMLGTLFRAGFKPKYLVKRTKQYLWQNPNSDSINIDSFRFEGSLEDLVRNIDNADGLFMEKVTR
ncbi:FkbM family methyltransferase [Chloroflexota bacterium]